MDITWHTYETICRYMHKYYMYTYGIGIGKRMSYHVLPRLTTSLDRLQSWMDLHAPAKPRRENELWIMKENQTIHYISTSNDQVLMNVCPPSSASKNLSKLNLNQRSSNFANVRQNMGGCFEVNKYNKCQQVEGITPRAWISNSGWVNVSTLHRNHRRSS